MGERVQRSLSNPVPWEEMFRTVSLSESRLPAETSEPGKSGSNHSRLASGHNELVNRIHNWANSTPDKPSQREESREIQMDSNRLKAMNFQLALYIAMAHAGLLLLIITLYGLGLLLKDFWKPIQWAVLCSITLREIQGTLVKFWEAPLQQGLLQTLLAVPFAICKGLVGTLHDAQAGVVWMFRRTRSEPVKVGFLKLLQWLVTFGVLTLGYDELGPQSLVTAIFTGLIAYAGLSSLGFFEDDGTSQASAEPVGKKQRRQSVTGKCIGWAAWPLVRIFRVMNKQSTRFIASRLRTIIALGLIVMMILGSVAGLVIFSYKVGFEAKDAVIALKDHVQQNNYTELIGLRQWLESNNVPGLIDQHASKAYETVSQQIDYFGAQYNVTEFTDAGKEYIIQLARGRSSQLSDDNLVSPSAAVISHPVVVRLHNARDLFREYDFKGIYTELEAAFFILLDHFHLKPEDVKEKVKQLSETGVDVGKRLFAGSSVLLSGGTSMILAVASSIASGAAGLFNFLTQTAVFFSLLYYLITSETGGVMEQVLGMVPLSDATRVRCGSVLNHAVSSVLLATVKSAFYQAAFTWLLFRFCKIHFLYVSTLVAIITALLPVLPHWLACLPAATQLAFQGDYVTAVVVTLVHFLVIDFGNRAIQDEIPGHNAYLAGLSIAGGMALFSPALEGAIMGPLLMTVLIALKNLYTEFVLNSEKDI